MSVGIKLKEWKFFYELKITEKHVYFFKIECYNKCIVEFYAFTQHDIGLDNLWTVMKNLTQTQKYVYCKKNYNFTPNRLILGTFICAWACYFDQVSRLQDKNCGFFTMNIFLSLGQFFRDSLYMNLYLICRCLKTTEEKIRFIIKHG